MIKLVDYIKDCLKDEKFRKVWEEENSDLDPYLFGTDSIEEQLKGLSIREALTLLDEMDDSQLTSIISNRGIHPEPNDLATAEIIFYEKGGKCPMEEFLSDIHNEKLKSKTLRNIVELSIKSNHARPPLSSYVDDGIFELRTKQSSNINRAFYFFIFGNKIIMTNGYVKKAQKLDMQEFEKAKKYRDDYMKTFKG